MQVQSSWICAQTYPSREGYALQQLRNQDYNVFFPIIVPLPNAKQPKKKRIDPRALFPGYLFIELREDQPWSPIHSTYGITRVLTRPTEGYMRPQLLPLEFILSLKRCVVSEDELLGGKLYPGVHVRVLKQLEGAKASMGDQEALISWRKERRLGLLFQIMGREVEIEFHIEDVELV